MTTSLATERHIPELRNVGHTGIRIFLKGDDALAAAEPHFDAVVDNSIIRDCLTIGVDRGHLIHVGCLTPRGQGGQCDHVNKVLEFHD